MSRSWGVLTLLILALSFWRSREDCSPDLDSSTIANLNKELLCTHTDGVAGTEELSLNCTGSDYHISHNIPHNSIEFIRVGMVCGPDCDTKLLDTNTILSGQVNITNATNCIVTGCYEARIPGAGSIQFLFHPLICMLEPELATSEISVSTSAPELTTSEIPVSTSSNDSALAKETTTELVVMTPSMQTSMGSISGVAEVAAIILSVLLLSIIATLIVIAAIAIAFGVKCWRNENRSYLSQLYLKSMNFKDDMEYDDQLDINPGKIEAPETKTTSTQSLFLALQSPATLHVAEHNEYVQPSVQSETFSSFSQLHLEGGECMPVNVLASLASVHSLPELAVCQEDSDCKEISYSSSLILEQSLSHEATDTECKTANKDLSLEGEHQLLNYQHSNEYIETILIAEQLVVTKDVQYKSESLTEQPMDFVDVSNDDGKFQVTRSDNVSEDNCAVVFEFGACSEDDDLLFSDSPGQETCSTAIAFDFSSSLHSAKEHHLATPLPEAMDPDKNIQTHDSMVSDDSIAPGYVKYKTTETGYCLVECLPFNSPDNFKN